MTSAPLKDLFSVGDVIEITNEDFPRKGEKFTVVDIAPDEILLLDSNNKICSITVKDGKGTKC